MGRRRSQGASGRSRYVLGFELRPGHILQVAETDSLLGGQVQLIQAVATLRANGATDVVVYLLQRATGQVWDRVPVASRVSEVKPAQPRIDF